VRRVPLLLVLAVLLPGRASAHDEERSVRPLLARAADEKDPDHAKALEAWQLLAPDDRAALARAGLRSPDPGTALVAAIAAAPETLDLQELRLQAKAQAPDPLARLLVPAPWKALHAGTHAYGSKDLLAIWTALGKRDPGPKDLDWSGLHRSLLPEDVPALVPLLETVGPRTFVALLDDLRTLAQQQAGPEHRGEFVRAFRYGLARLRAAAAKKRPPPLADLPPLAAKPGLPAEFVEIARGTWLDASGFAAAGKAPQETTRVGPEFWLHRWAMELTPVEADVPFLLELIEDGATLPQTARWAARRVAALSGRGGLQGRAAGHALRKVLGMDDGIALHAAAQRAAEGDAEDWKRLLPRTKGAWEPALWLADPAAAETAVVALLQSGDPIADLEEPNRLSLELDLGVVVPDAALARIGERLAAAKVPLETELWFHAKVFPEGLTREACERLASTWVARAGDLDAGAAVVRNAVALLDARAPETTVAMLRAWAKAATKDARPHVLDLLARTGDAALWDDLAAAWPGGDEDRRFLGRVKDPRVEPFLRGKAASAQREEESAAVAGLAILFGCPESLAAVFVEPVGGPRESPDPSWERAKALVLEKDPVGGALEVLRDGPHVVSGQAHFAGLALSKDPRALERLRSWRASRHGGVYWEATGALALAGDVPGREEWRAFLAENRAFLLDGLQEGMLGTLDGDPEWIAFWVSRFDSNCCHALHAHLMLSSTYPTLPFANGAGDSGRARRGAERWFAKHQGTFVRSRILDGWVPGLPAK
jgi:hypothetical protein